MTQPTPSAPSASPQATLDAAGRDRVAAAVAAEHAAVYGYGVLGPRLAASLRPAARTAESAHRRRRDQFALILGDGAPDAAAAYATPPLPDAAAALALAVQIEERVTAAYRAALAATGDHSRRLVLDAMIDAASRATAWRKAAGQTPLTGPFPGRPA